MKILVKKQQSIIFKALEQLENIFATCIIAELIVLIYKEY